MDGRPTRSTPDIGTAGVGAPDIIDLDRWDITGWAAAEAIDERRRRHWRAQEERDTTTLVGLLVTLAEGGSDVGVSVEGDRRFDGHIRGIGEDMVSLQTRDGRRTLVNLARVRWIRPTGTLQLTGDRTPPVALRFVEAVAELCAEQPDVAVHLESGEPVRGRLRWCGEDVCCITDPSGRLPTYISLGHITALAVM